jgi:spore germination protein PA
MNAYHYFIYKQQRRLTMPSIVGNIKLIGMQYSSTAHVGDSLQISPNSVTKAFSGAGSFNTGDFASTNNANSNTNTDDRDISDSTQTNVGNGVT